MSNVQIGWPMQVGEAGATKAVPRRPSNDEQETRYREFKAFVTLHVEPFAAQWDREQRIPESVMAMVGESGYLGSTLPTEYGGLGWDTVTFGLLNEAFGRGSSALTDVLTVQAMVSMSLLKWGTKEQKEKWLPRLAKGQIIAGFAMTEPGAGSNIQLLSTALAPDGQHFILNGNKKWISCAQFAGVFLVFGKLEHRAVACLVPSDARGVTVEPIQDLMGFRAAGLGEIHFQNVSVPSADLVGKPGFAFSHIAPHGLQYGRISTACSALGLLRGCFEESVAYGAKRTVGHRRVGDFGMIRSMIATMGANLEAARLLCDSACRAQDNRLPEAYQRTLIAKYFASRAAGRAASDAVQIQGASGCHGSSPVSRYYRDAKIMEIVEGTTQIHECLLGELFVSQGGSRQ